MNDIEILENMVQQYKNANFPKAQLLEKLEVRIYKHEITAIENLIQRNKDLEQIEREHKEENGRLRKENINLKEKIIRQQEQLNIANKKILAQKGQLKVVNNSYIPKSKIKEKMEELTKIKGDLATYIATSERIKVLQELLEESKK